MTTVRLIGVDSAATAEGAQPPRRRGLGRNALLPVSGHPGWFCSTMRGGLLLIVFALFGAGCGSGPGEFCQRDKDCRAGLRCATATSEGGRGICTYPATSDAAPADLRVDARPTEAGQDATQISDVSARDTKSLDLPPKDTSPDLPSADL